MLRITCHLAADPSSVDALLGLAETQITLHIFGFTSREETIPEAREAFQQVWKLDSLNSGVRTLEGMLAFLDWKWEDARDAFQVAIGLDPQNLKARHWYSLYFSAMGLFDEAMAQSDTISSMDPAGFYLIGRGSLLYFARRNVELKELMIKVVAKDTTVAWGYDWLGMAYIELEEYENSIDTYYKAFNLSEGTVEVGGGLGHALGLAGDYATAKQMLDDDGNYQIKLSLSDTRTFDLSQNPVTEIFKNKMIEGISEWNRILIYLVVLILVAPQLDRHAGDCSLV